ncbi:hypothetical protein EZS27_026490 [termite gut metagenome]|uniref:Uncharacterized protein n=1 Tax=termite gut metagenome TaxID=433724 RepID=A0A5J4QQN9_9ZZZZ
MAKFNVFRIIIVPLWLISSHKNNTMENNIYDFKLNTNWKLINLIGEIDRFDSQWIAIERKEGQSLGIANLR